VKGVQTKLKAGEYQFDPETTPIQVLEKIVRGERLVRRVIIPEGYNFSQMAAAFEAAGIAPVAETMKYFRDPKLLALLPFPASSLEGFLFPDTYEYDRDTQAGIILVQMIQRFLQVIQPEITQRVQQTGWTIPQVITLASLIEKETGVDQERPVISSVFFNRLKIGMPLQSDPTVIYGLVNFDGNLKKGDLANPHPYNTYVHTGLPPGPIASPGKKSIEAVLSPAATSYLFFVSQGNGTHQFSSNLEEHNAAVGRYQLGKPETKPSINYRHPIMKPSPMPRK
jgi:UPF0755 protein